MTLYFEEEGEGRLPLECESFARQIIEDTLNYIGCPYEAEVSLLLTTNEQIHEMNREFRGIDRPTDVLSFPMVQYPVPENLHFLKKRKIAFIRSPANFCLAIL